MKRRTKESGSVASSASMTFQEVADYLDCSYAKVLLHVMRDNLLAFRLKGVVDGWRVRRSDLKKWIARQHVRPADK
jgi:excisionase family DNA binding protein